MEDYTEDRKFSNKYQSDLQEGSINKRTEEQQYLVDNYFIIKEKINEKFLLAAIISVVVTLICFAINVFVGIFFVVVSLILIAFCLSLKQKHPQISDKEYEEHVTKKIKELNVEARGLEKLGLDSDQIKEIKPFCLTNRVFNKNSLKRKDKKFGFFHSSSQNIVYLYFTNKQVFIYDLTFDMCCNLYEENMDELFYKDICDIKSTTSNKYIATTIKEEIETDSSKTGSESNSEKSRIKNLLSKIFLSNQDSSTEESSTTKKIEITTTTYEIISVNSKVVFTFVGSSNADENNTNLETAQAMRQKIREVRNK